MFFDDSIALHEGVKSAEMTGRDVHDLIILDVLFPPLNNSFFNERPDKKISSQENS